MVSNEDIASRAREAIEPLLLQYGVDLFVAGHVHDYESTFPVKRCALSSTHCYVGKDLHNPLAPVHVVAGQVQSGMRVSNMYANISHAWLTMAD